MFVLVLSTCPYILAVVILDVTDDRKLNISEVGVFCSGTVFVESLTKVRLFESCFELTL
jgi:hypothetical protein